MFEKQIVVLDGKFIDAEEAVLQYTNRAFRYGDAVFESMFASSGKIRFFENHFERLIHGIRKLKMQVPVSFNRERVGDEIGKLLIKNKIFTGSRIRLTVFRKDGGFYIPQTNELSYLIEVYKNENTEYVLNTKGLSIGVYDEDFKQKNLISDIKSANALFYVMAGIYCHENKFDDCLILNENQNVIEAISSNLFLVKDNFIFTPSLDEGCLPGIMRHQVIELALKMGFIVYDDCIVREKDLLEADEIFLTNAVSGIKWVLAFKDRRYFSKVSKKIISELNRKFN